MGKTLMEGEGRGSGVREDELEGGWRGGMADDGERAVEKEVELQLAVHGGECWQRWSGRRSWRRGWWHGGPGRRRLENSSVAMMAEKNPWPGQGVAAAATTTVGLLPRPSLSSHLRGRSLLSFFK